MNIDPTEKFLRGKLKEFTKEEIVTALFRELNFTQIDNIAERCRQMRVMRQIEVESKRKEDEKNALKEYIDEYNKLVEESNAIGFVNMPAAKINRMATLLKILKNGRKNQ